MSVVALHGPAAVTPGLAVPDPLARHWLARVNLLLRREVAWCWRQRFGRPDPGDGSLPPQTDACAENLDWVRYREHKRRFLAEDPAGRYLDERLRSLGSAPAGGPWARVADALDLDEPAGLVLALALAHRLDAGLGPVFAACMNDASRPWPSLALAQRLWDDPAGLTLSAAADRPLLRFGLVRLGAGDDADPATPWQQPLVMSPWAAAALAGLAEPGALAGLVPCDPAGLPDDGGLRQLGWRLAGRDPSRLEILPLIGPASADGAGCAAALAGCAGRRLLRAPDWLVASPEVLPDLSVLAWLADADLLVPEALAAAPAAAPEHPPAGVATLAALARRCRGLPLRWYLPVAERKRLETLPADLLLPAATVPRLGWAERRSLMIDGLGATGERLRETVEDCARRFRLQRPALERVLETLRGRSGVTADELIDACRIEAELHLGYLAQAVTPRFTRAELVLPAAQDRQIDEVLQAMRALTRVHYRWGTARVWNEAGLAVLFSGPPGTGKTMAAEVLAEALRLDLYRVDLSQVVNKYIGETEKNLKRIFDAAETSDCILFFDEADALFGKRTDVKDAHDRFANIEISYLLERMERFKGLAILASNRRKDLDEAFLRRLRYLIDFPMPGPAERERIWRNGFPPAVDCAGLDFRYLARQFALAGGSIRSVIFNACLQAAGAAISEPLPPGTQGRVGMAEVLVQVKRELQKMDRAAGNEQFGAYAKQMEEWAP